MRNVVREKLELEIIMDVRTEELEKLRLEILKNLEKLKIKKLRELHKLRVEIKRLEIKRIVKEFNELTNDSNINLRIESRKYFLIII